MRGRDRRGVALLLSILVLMILIVIVLQMTVTASQNRFAAGAAISDLQNGYGTKSGYYHALLILQADLERDKETSKQIDWSGEKWAEPLTLSVGDSTVTVRMVDTESKLNVQLVVKESLERDSDWFDRLQRLVDLLWPEHSDAAQRIAAYLDKETGSEYDAGAKNARLINLEELLRIPNIPPEVWAGDVKKQRKGLLEFLTLWPLPPPPAPEGGTPPPGTPAPTAAVGKINVNTAPLELIQILHKDITPEMAQKVIDGRVDSQGKATPYETVDAVSGFLGAAFNDIKNLLVVESKTFEIHARAKVSTVERAWLYVVQQEQEKFKRIATMRENDFLWVRPEEEEGP